MLGAALRWTWVDWLVLVLVTAAGGLLRLARIGRPDSLVFDEIYYAQDACLLVLRSTEACGTAPYTGGHPPLGELLIGVGIAVFGNDALGWRVMPFVAGTLTIGFTYLLARRLLASTLGAVIASVLLAIDFLHFVHSRVAMLDIFVALFTVAAFTFAVLDRDALFDAARDGRAIGLVRGRGWRLAAGAAGGAAAACKWSGALALFGVIILVIAWEIAGKLRDGRGSALLRAVAHGAPSAFIGLGLIPLAVYSASYLGTMQGELLALPWAEGSWLRNVVAQQFVMGRVHVTIPGHHPYESPGWSWILIKQPVAYYFDTFRGDYQEILAMGNPLVWWPSIGAAAYLLYRWIRSRSVSGAEPVILVGFAATLLPWLFVVEVRNATFLFYILPTVPFICLAVAALLSGVAARGVPGRAVVGVYLVACLAAFAFYYPILAAVPTPPAAWEARILFNDCMTEDGYRAVPNDERSQGVPPAGWCWR